MKIPGEKQLQHAIDDIGRTVRRKAPAWAVGLCCVIGVMLAFGAGFLVFTKDIWFHAIDLQHLQRAHDECAARLAEHEKRIRQLEGQLNVATTTNP